MERVSVTTDLGPMPARLWLPPAGSGPGLLLLQEIFGVSRYIERRAKDLAALGYVVIAPNLYWRLNRQVVSEGPAMLDEGMELAAQLEWAAALEDAQATLHHLRSRREVTIGTGVIGFCYGGGLGYALVARDPTDALVSFYGSALPLLIEQIPSISTPSLHIFGEEDSFISLEVVHRIQKSVMSGGGPVEFRTYAGADHAFDNDDFVNYHPRASSQAWQAASDWLDRNLPV